MNQEAVIKDEVFHIEIKPTIKQAQAWKKLRDRTTRFLLFGGGGGGGKSWVGCEWLLINCIAYPGTKWFIGRNELKRIMNSTYLTFRKVCKAHDIPESAWTLKEKYNYIEFWNGSRIDLVDLAYKPTDPLYERFGSVEYTSGWLEEAGEIKGKAFDVLKSRIGRHMNDEYNLFPKMFLTCNPKKNWLYHDFYKPWKENRLDADCCFIQSLYKDNPYTEDEYGAILSKIKDNVLRSRLRDGNWEYEDDDSALMTYEKITNMFTNTFEPGGDFYLSVDVARFGRDKAVLILWQGYHIRRVWFYDKSSTQFLEDKIKSKCEQYHIPIINVVVDQDGVGGGVVDHLPGVWAFTNAGRPIEAFDDSKEFRQQETERYSYKNLRSQCYDKLADAINQGKISCYKEIDPQVRDWIIQELEAIKKKDVEDNEKKFQVISKDDIKEIIGRSPDFADSLMMRFVFDLSKPKDDYEVGIAW
jgi:hypothetical protein